MIEQLIGYLILALINGLVILAIQELVLDSGGVLHFLVRWIENLINECKEEESRLADFIENLKAENVGEGERQSLPLANEETYKKRMIIAGNKAYVIRQITKPLYWCSICMASIHGTWFYFTAAFEYVLPVRHWPFFCLLVAGILSVYENRETETNVVLKFPNQ